METRMAEKGSGKIFINYRRGDGPCCATALYMRLEDEFGCERLFMDVDHIKPGYDFEEVLRSEVGQCDVLLAVVGPRWAELLASRAGDPEDFVVVEIKAALDLGKRVIPVLIGDTQFPPADILPESIRAFGRKNAVSLRLERFKDDYQGLSRALKESLQAAEMERSAKPRPDSPPLAQAGFRLQGFRNRS